MTLPRQRNPLSSSFAATALGMRTALRAVGGSPCWQTARYALYDRCICGRRDHSRAGPALARHSGKADDGVSSVQGYDRTAAGKCCSCSSLALAGRATRNFCSGSGAGVGAFAPQFVCVAIACVQPLSALAPRSPSALPDLFAPRVHPRARDTSSAAEQRPWDPASSASRRAAGRSRRVTSSERRGPGDAVVLAVATGPARPRQHGSHRPLEPAGAGWQADQHRGDQQQEAGRG